MSGGSAARSTQAARRVYRAALRLLPADFRRSQAPGLQSFLDDQLREAAPRGRASVWWRLSRALTDLMMTALTERFARLRPLAASGGHIRTDVVHVARRLRRYPHFTLIVLGSIGLGVGIGTAAFTAVNAALLAPLPFADADRLLRVEAVVDSAAGPVSYPDFNDWRTAPGPLAQAAAFSWTNRTVTGLGSPFRAPVTMVSAAFFETLGTPPMRGRTFTPAEEREGADAVAIISARFWRQHFGTRTDILDQSLVLNGRSYAIVGTLPDAFQFDLNPSDVFIPLGVRTLDERLRASRWLGVIGRLSPGASATAVEDVLRASDADGTPGAVPIRAQSLREAIAGPTRGLLLLLLTGALVVALAISASLATISATRAAANRRERAVRTAIGASDWALARLSILEWLTLAIGGAALALVAGRAAFDAAWSLLPASTTSNLTMVEGAAVDSRVVLFTIAAAVMVTLPALLVAVREGAGLDLTTELRGVTLVTRSRARTRSALVAAQVALALPLAVGGGLLSQSLTRLVAVDAGFRPEGLVTLSLSLPADRYRDPSDVSGFYNDVVDRVRAIPGVERAGLVDELPFTRNTGIVDVQVEASPDQAVPALIRSASPDYLETVGVALQAGRTFTASDRPDGPLVTVVSESLARQVFGDRTPLGRSITMAANGRQYRVIGVVADLRMGELDRAWQPSMYTSSLQDPSRSSSLVVRTALEPGVLAPEVRALVNDRDPALPVYAVHSLTDVMWNTRAVSTRQLILLGLEVFGALAVLVALAGVYSLLSHSVAQQTREIGLRLALGAEPTQVLWLVVSRGLMLTGTGVLVGVAVSLAAGRTLRHLLFNTSSTDPVTFAAAGGGLLLLALLASLLPAWRAARVDPVVALRGD